MRRLGTFALLVLLALASVASHAQAVPEDGASSGGSFVELDHVVAVINGDVLLQSDVDEEMRFAALEPLRPGAGRDTPQDALRRLIARTLIVQQMRDQQQFNVKITDSDVEKSLAQLRAHLPACAKYHCETEAGWDTFLASRDLTASEVDQHWRRRLAILRFIDLRFRAGIRIAPASIDEYYEKSVVPAFARRNEAPPALKALEPRIEQVLLEQQVNGLLRDWLKSLRAEGSVRILDPAYASVIPSTQASASGGADDE